MKAYGSEKKSMKLKMVEIINKKTKAELFLKVNKLITSSTNAKMKRQDGNY